MSPARTLIISDVHGCYFELDDLVNLLKPTSDDRVVFLGDLMDRGPYPVACVSMAMGMGAEVVRSNHDEKHVRWRKHHEARMAGGKKNPIRFTDAQAVENLGLSRAELSWMANAPMSIDLGCGWRAVHAGLEPAKTFDEQKDCESLMRTRFINDDGSACTAKDPNASDPVDKWFWADRWHGPENIVYGHHIHSLIGPHITHGSRGWGQPLSTCVGLDTGCYAGGRMSAMILMPDGQYWFESAKARAVYCPLSDKYARKPDGAST